MMHRTLPNGGCDISPNWKKLQEEVKVKTEVEAVDDVARCSGMKTAGACRRKASPANFRTKKGKQIWRNSNKRQGFQSVERSDNADEHKTPELTRVLALDCEYVGAGARGNENMLARVSMVNLYGQCIYDKFVKPVKEVTDYRTRISGVRPSDLVNGESFQIVRREVSRLLDGRILVGHSLEHDFKVLQLVHPRRLKRDTAKYFRLRMMANTDVTPSLKLLAKNVLGIDIQNGEHDSVTDAATAMRLYVFCRKQWEADVQRYK